MNDVRALYSHSSRKPRIVAATVKSSKNGLHFREIDAEKPRIAGDLKIITKSFCQLRYAEVQCGNLILYKYVGRNKKWDCRIPLYNLNINLDSQKHPYQFTLSKYGELTSIASFQVTKGQDYNNWLKALVVEIIRQTPLNILKFLDVLLVNHTLQMTKSREYKFIKKSNKHIISKCCKMQNNLTLDSLGKYDNVSETCTKYDINGNEQIDFIEIDLPDGGNVSRNFSLNEPLGRNDRRHCAEFGKPYESYDSGFDSLHCNTPSTVKTKMEVYEEPTSLPCYVQDFQPKFKLKRSNHREIYSSHKKGEKIISNTPVKEPHHLWRRSDDQGLQKTDLHASRRVSFNLPENLLQNENANVLIRLLTKCQIDKEYVPVREKLLLFESLSRFSFSVGNLRERIESLPERADLVRSKSVQDLQGNRSSVRAIRSYFESFSNHQ